MWLKKEGWRKLSKAILNLWEIRAFMLEVTISGRKLFVVCCYGPVRVHLFCGRFNTLQFQYLGCASLLFVFFPPRCAASENVPPFGGDEGPTGA